MKDQHTKISGYRDLSEAEVALMNKVKDQEAVFNGLIDELRATPGLDQRQVSLAATNGEDAFMHAVRAVAQPTRMSAPKALILDLGDYTPTPEEMEQVAAVFAHLDKPDDNPDPSQPSEADPDLEDGWEASEVVKG